MEFGIDKATRERVSPKHGLLAICQCCENDLIPKCGKINIHHWAHKVNHCDPWWEPETEWHRNWKSKFPAEWREVIKFNSENKEKHIADIYNPNKNLVIEFQNSPISKDELESREKFYQKLIWVVNVHNSSIKLQPVELYDYVFKTFAYTFIDSHINSFIIVPNEVMDKLIRHRDMLIRIMIPGSFEKIFNEMIKLFDYEFDLLIKQFNKSKKQEFKGVDPAKAKRELLNPIVEKARIRIEQIIKDNKSLDEANQYCKYIWRRRKRVWDFASMNVFLDTGHELLWVQTSTIAKKITYDKFISKYNLIS